jgi:hypothetical protein
VNGTDGEEIQLQGRVAGFEADRELERLSIRTDHDEILTFDIGGSVPIAAWNRRHLDAQKASGQRLIVTFVDEEGILVATKLKEGRLLVVGGREMGTN